MTQTKKKNTTTKKYNSVFEFKDVIKTNYEIEAKKTRNYNDEKY